MVFIMATLIIMAMIYASSPVVKTQERIDCTQRFARVAIFPKPNSRRSAVTSVRPSTSAVAAKKRSAGSGCSSGNSWAIVPGLGKRERIDCLGVKWPLLGGETQRFNDLPIDRCIAIVEGEEKWN